MMETPSNQPEVQKSPEQIKTDVARVVTARKAELSNWMKISDDEVAVVKDELKKALGLPASEKISVTAPGDRAGVSVIVESVTNPLRRYCSTRILLSKDGAPLEKIELNVNTAAFDGSPRINKVILEALKIPADAKVTFERTERPGITEHKVIDRESKKVLGIVEVNEKTAAIGRIQRDEQAIEKLAPLKMADCMAALGKDGRLRDIAMRKTVEQAVRSELNLPAAFANRDLFISGKQTGDEIVITVEDKMTEKVIAEMKYSTKSNEFTSQTVNKAAIKEIVK